jgi:tetratricopeptide (TPR) repeat protein
MENDPKIWFLRREPVILLTLASLAAVFFTGVLFLARSYQRHREKLGRQLYALGLAEVRLQHFEAASRYFRGALDYSRDSYAYQLHLAQALNSDGRSNEAVSYLLGLWDQQPEDGTVNLDLARIYAARGDSEKAIRYYHNAIYAIWLSAPDANRRKARLELVQLFLKQKAFAQAQAELIAMASNLPEDSALHLQAADLFLEVQDYEHALLQYRYVLRLEHKNENAHAGAGRAAFELGQYAEAKSYLQAALAINPADQDAVRLLRSAELVLNQDPFGRRLTDSERARRVLHAFNLASRRLKECAPNREASSGQAAADPLQSLLPDWTTLKPKVGLARLARSPQLRDAVMDLVFRIESAAGTGCGTPSQEDSALLLISRDRERNER